VGVNILIKINKKERELKEWNKMKSNGKAKYIWINGVLKWGLFMAISIALILQAIGEGFSLYSFSNQNFIKKLIIFFVIFSIDGYIHNILLWRKYEKKYNDR
jgi:hypothetical protein